MNTAPETVVIHEVGPRDGLQNEPGVIGLDAKLALIAALAEAGLREIEIGSFVSPKWVPQMAASGEVLARVAPGPRYGVLVPNLKGWEAYRAVETEASSWIAVFVSATEGFSRANLNCSVAESIERARPVVDAARAAGVAVRGYVSCVTDCPFEGRVPPGQVAQVAERLTALGDMQLSLGDTIGQGDPERVDAMLGAVLDVAAGDRLAGHFHDTNGQALDNVRVSLERGLRAFDSAVGGLGGCPYAPGAPGNLATEALVEMLAEAGFATGVDPDRLAEAARMARAMKGTA